MSKKKNVRFFREFKKNTWMNKARKNCKKKKIQNTLESLIITTT